MAIFNFDEKVLDMDRTAYERNSTGSLIYHEAYMLGRSTAADTVREMIAHELRGVIDLPDNPKRISITLVLRDIKERLSKVDGIDK